MESATFDSATRSLATGASRRHLLRGLAAVAAAAATGGVALADASARRGRDKANANGHGRKGRKNRGAVEARGIGDMVTGLYKTYTYQARVTCPTGIDDLDGDPQTCDIPFQHVFPKATSVKLEIIANPRHCSDVRFFVEYRNAAGDQNWTSARMGPGDSTGVRDLGAGIEWIAVYAEGFQGGCNAGTLSAWEAAVKLTVPRTVTVLLP